MAGKVKQPVYVPGHYGGVTPKDENPKRRRLLEPPYGSYDPSIDAQERAAQRGLKDLRQDITIADNWASQDLRQKRFDTTRGWRRQKTDLRRSVRRENQKIGYRRSDLKLDAKRSRQDFASRLAGVSRQFSNLATSQMEAQNASGTLHGGAAAASAAKRAQNQALAVQPIQTAQGRMEQDLATNLTRLNVAQRQTGSDFATSLTRGRQDMGRDRKLITRDYTRDRKTRKLKLSRGIREEKAGEADLLAQRIYSARQNHPGSFTKTGRKRG